MGRGGGGGGGGGVGGQADRHTGRGVPLSPYGKKEDLIGVTSFLPTRYLRWSSKLSLRWQNSVFAVTKHIFITLAVSCVLGAIFSLSADRFSD